MSTITKKLKVPGILSDIDGVIYRGKQTVGNSTSVLSKLLRPIKLKGTELKLPFACLTNGGGTLERDRATLFNNIVFG